MANSAIFEQVTIVEDVRFLTPRTVYSVTGDAMAYVAIALTASALIVLRRAGSVGRPGRGARLG